MNNDEFDPKMLEVLICPMTQGRLTLNRENAELISYSASLAYPIRSGVPIMLGSEARPLELGELAKHKANSRIKR